MLPREIAVEYGFRLGAAHVTMVYRRSDREMTCYEHEYDFGRRESVEFRFLWQPSRVLLDDGLPAGLERGGWMERMDKK